MNTDIKLTEKQRAEWSAKLEALETNIREIKLAAASQLNPGLGSHPIVDGLCACESLLWSLGEMVEKFPSRENPPNIRS
jgi:hypothetical protein